MPLRLGFSHAEGAGKGGGNDRWFFSAPEEGPMAARGAVLTLSDAAGSDQRGGALADSLARGFASGWFSSPETWSPPRSLEAICTELNTQARAHHAGFVATLTAAVVHGRHLHLAHVGDCRAWLVRGGESKRLTQDHTWRQPDLRAALHRAYGLDETVHPDIVSLELAPGDLVVLASDGIHKEVDEGAWAALEASPDSAVACAEVLKDVRRRGGDDDATLLALRIVELPAPEEIRFADAGIPLDPVDDPVAGADVDGFRLVRRISRGRCSQVWLADDRAGERKVVLKIPEPATARDPEAREEFLREEWIGRRVHHPALVPVLDLEPGRRTRLYFAMPYVPGTSLRQVLEREGVLDAFELRRMFLEIYPALLALHRQGVLHRDLKPDNILRDERGRYVLCDLGVARIEAMEAGSGRSPGTPSYMAPELFEGAGANEGTEIYALGASLYECLTRRLPHGEIEPFVRPRFGVVPPASRWNPLVPQWLDRIVHKCLETDPARRFQALSELAHAMDRQELVEDRGHVEAPARPGRGLLLWAVLATLAALLEGFYLASHSGR